MRIPSFALLCLLAMLAWVKPAQAETFNTCTGFITSIPAVISTQGTWCLKQDLTTAISSGNAITIATNNVTIDCNDFKFGGQAAGFATLAHGIEAQDRLNATVRHCNIRGFYVGLALQGSSGGGYVVEDNRFDGNTGIGIEVDGDGWVVRRNQVFDTGGSTVSNGAVGIAAYVSGDVLDNTVSGVVARTGSNGEAYGIFIVGNPGVVIGGNRIRGLVKDGSGADHGIDSVSAVRLVLRDNTVIGDGSAGSGLSCISSAGRAKDNVISGFAPGIFGCADAGGNDISG